MRYRVFTKSMTVEVEAKNEQQARELAQVTLALMTNPGQNVEPIERVEVQ